jgi:hypothetical protein
MINPKSSQSLEDIILDLQLGVDYYKWKT